jgi:hypothetical protein
MVSSGLVFNARTKQLRNECVHVRRKPATRCRSAGRTPPGGGNGLVAIGLVATAGEWLTVGRTQLEQQIVVHSGEPGAGGE